MKMMMSGTSERPWVSSISRAASSGSPRFVWPAFVLIDAVHAHDDVGDTLRQLMAVTIWLDVLSDPSDRS